MPHLFSNEEYADIHLVYGFCNGNAEEASREYGRRFPNRRHPVPKVFVNTHLNFRQLGLKVSHREVDIRNERNRNEILNMFDDDNQLSTRRASRQLRAVEVQASKDKVSRTLRKDHRKPYHLQPVQNLIPEDGPKRLNFCNWLINSVQRDAAFLSKILWSDEATFTRRGVVNYHNLHVWAHENPHAIRPRSFQREFSVNVWLGVINDNLCGPHFLPNRLNSDHYLEFLQNYLFQHLEEVPLNLLQQGWLQMDGAPAHFGVIVRNWCNDNFPLRWIGRLGNHEVEGVEAGQGPKAWPPRSPDLTVLDFFVWGYIKEKVYATPVATEDQLVLRIQEACNSLRANRHQILAAVNSTLRRCHKCIEANGMHFEQLL